MAIYDPKSLKAEEFINDGEIVDTLKYADENKDNMALIDEIIEKTKLTDGDEVGLGGIRINGSRQEQAAYFLVRIGSCT